MLHVRFEEACGSLPVQKYCTDICAGKNGGDIVWANIFYAAVSGARYIAMGNNVPQGDSVLQKKSFLALCIRRYVAARQTRQKPPETVLRVRIEELLLSGFNGRKTAENEYF